MKKSRYLAIVAVALVPVSLLMLSSSRPAAQEKPAAAAKSDSRATVAAPGIVEPASEEREIAAELTGVIDRVLVEENERVKRGQPLATIKNKELVAKLAGAKAQLSLRESELVRLLNGARPQERRAAAASVDEAEALLRLATAEDTRSQKLQASGTISLAERDQSRHGFESATAKVRAAKERLSLIQAPARDDEVAQAKALVDVAKAQIAEIEALVDKTTIVSPIDGTVLRRFKDAGETVTLQPATVMFSVGDLTRLHVRTEIDETDIARVQVGQRVYVSADAFRGQRFPGKVVRVANRLGSKTIQTERPSEKADTKILEATVELEGEAKLPIGLRVDVFVE
jgi:HlyD family secretion protein